MIRRAARLLLVAGCATSLAACITLFPKEKPAQLFRFDAQKYEKLKRKGLNFEL